MDEYYKQLLDKLNEIVLLAEKTADYGGEFCLMEQIYKLQKEADHLIACLDHKILGD